MTAAGGGSSRAHARDVRPPGGRLVGSGVGPDEQNRLRSALGALLVAERQSASYGTRRLAAAVGCARSTITRLEAGEFRPRRGLLTAIASALCPDRPKPLADRLCAAAGASLRPDTPGSARQRRKRAQDAILAGRRPLPDKLARAIGLHRQAADANRRAMQLLARPGAYEDVALLEEAMRLMDASRRLSEQAGPAMILRLGKHEIRAGWTA